MTRPSYAGGSGSEEDPFLIQTAEHLNTIGLSICDWDKQFRLVADIDLTDYSGESGNPAFNVIANYVVPFSGVFDGAGHTISNFTHRNDEAWSGLFTLITGHNTAIRNVTLADVNLSIRSGGALVGMIQEGTVDNCRVTGGSVTGIVVLGGLVGYVEQGKITNSNAVCDVSGRAVIGGLAGRIRESNIADCDAGGSVTGSGRGEIGGLIGLSDYHSAITRCHAICSAVSGRKIVGGLIGHNRDSNDIIACYSRGNVSGEQHVGGLIGWNNCNVTDSYSKARITGDTDIGGLVGRNLQEGNSQGHILRCYAAGRVEGQENVGGLVGNNSEEELPGLVTDSFWDTEASGQAVSDGGEGKTTAEMMRTSTFISAGWDYSTPVWKIHEGMSTPWLWWEDVDAGGTGTAEDPYLIATAEQMQAVGANPEIWDKHFRVIADIDLASYTGTEFNIIGTTDDPFTGTFDGGGWIISNFTYTADEEQYVGIFGVAGGEAEIEGVRLLDPAIDAGTSMHVGALVGYLDGRVSECGARGGDVTGGRYAGGLVGWSSGRIDKCYAKNDVSSAATDSYAGGIVGYSRGRIDNSYAINTVTGAASGGLVGELSQGRMKCCYAAGFFGAGGSIGGLIGRNDRGTIVSSYWNLRTSRVRRMCGVEFMASSCDDDMGKMPGEMTRSSTFVGWNFDSIWDIDEGNGFPRLRWEDQ
jgi:hypothetical protein